MDFVLAMHRLLECTSLTILLVIWLWFGHRFYSTKKGNSHVTSSDFICNASRIISTYATLSIFTIRLHSARYPSLSVAFRILGGSWQKMHSLLHKSVYVFIFYVLPSVLFDVSLRKCSSCTLTYGTVMDKAIGKAQTGRSFNIVCG